MIRALFVDKDIKAKQTWQEVFPTIVSDPRFLAIKSLEKRKQCLAEYQVQVSYLSLI